MKCSKKRCFIMLIITALLFCLLIFISINIFESFNKNLQNQTCTTPYCNKTVSILQYNMNLNVNPCDDFYEFTCGNFVRNIHIPDENAYVMLLNIHSYKILKDLRNILEEPILNDIEPYAMMKMLYFSCMNEKSIQMNSFKTLIDILDRLGGWPILNKNWNVENFDWINTTIHVGKFGYSINSIININVDLDARNSTKRILSVDQPVLGLNREFLITGIQNEIVKTYFNYMVNVSINFGANFSVQSSILDILLFEIELAKISLSNEQRQNVNKLYNLVSVKELQETYPFIPWLKVINNILPSTIQIDDSEMLLNVVPDYLSKLEIILKKTPKRTIANYILWNVVRESLPFLTKEFRIFGNQMDAKLTGKVKYVARWQECISVVQDTLPIALGSFYVYKYFKNESKIRVEEIFKQLKFEYKSLLLNNEWMDMKTKLRALDKIDALNAFVAFPDELLDDNKLINYYKNLTINENFYLDSALNISKYLSKKSFNELRIPFGENKWTRHSHTFVVDAYYSPLENSLDIPAAILDLLFSSEHPHYINYGNIGFVIGHEMTHGFDNYGRQFDKNGNLVDWWEKSANDAFLQKAQCIIKQYENYTIENMSLNGVNTLGENIADNGAIQIAYNAYVKWLETHKDKAKDEDRKIFDFNFTARQMFWISAANLWCTKYRPEYLKVYLATNAHSPARFRVNGVVSNQIQFAEDFNCPLGSNMNPLHKCKIW